MRKIRVPWFRWLGKLFQRSRQVRVSSADTGSIDLGKQLLLRLFENADEFILVCRPDGRILDLNQRACDMLGLSEAAARGQDLSEMMGEAGRILAVVAHRVAQTGRLEEIEHEIQRGDETIRLSSRVYPLKGPDGTVQAVGIFCYDMTERYRMEQALAASEAELRTLLNQVPHGVTIIEGGRFVFYNEAVLELIDPSIRTPEFVEKISQMNFLDFVHPDDRPFVKELYQRRFEGPRFPQSFEIRMNPDFGHRWIEVHTRRIEYRGKPAVLVILIDITTRKRLEKMLIRSQKMEAVGRLAGGIAHDMNNLLTPILGAVEMLTFEVGNHPKARSHLEMIRQVVEQARSLTRQLLIFSRRNLISPERLNLNHILERFQELFPRIMGEQIRWTMDLAPDLPDIYAGASQIEQLVLNLLVNAREAMPDGGDVRITTRRFTVEPTDMNRIAEMEPGEYVVLEVSDTGKGMTPEVQEHIFEPFYTTKPDGSGMGLATVYAIVRQLNGHIHVYSEVGEGTLFRIYIPAFQTPAYLAKKKPEGHEAGSRKIPKGHETILVIEDQEEVRGVTCEFLRQLGYDVYDVATLAEARAWLESQARPPDLILSDVVLTDGRGPQFYETIRLEYPSIRVIFMSGYPADQGGLGKSNLAQYPFLLKPFNFYELAVVIRKVIEGKTSEE